MKPVKKSRKQLKANTVLLKMLVPIDIYTEFEKRCGDTPITPSQLIMAYALTTMIECERGRQRDKSEGARNE